MKLLRKIHSLFLKRKHEAQMAEEMQAHLDGLAERNAAAGMSPEEARYAARRAFGGVEQIKERARDERSFLWLEQSLQDLRYAVRQLRKSPGFTLVAVLSLAIGIGANTAVFSVADDWLLKPLAVKHPGELVAFQWVPGAHGGRPKSDGGDVGNPDVDAASGQQVSRQFSTQTYRQFRAASGGTLEDCMAVAPLLGASVVLDGAAESLRLGQLVSGNYYTLLGVRAAHGRLLDPSDDQPGAPPVGVVSYGYWQGRLAGDAAVVGRTLVINRVPVTVVGVSAEEFPGTLGGGGMPDLTLPLALAEQLRPDPDGVSLGDASHWWLRVVGRLKPGASVTQARLSLEGAFLAGAREAGIKPDSLPRLLAVSAGRRFGVAERGQVMPLVVIFAVMVGLLLLAACANVANLLVARGAGRRSEIAVRLALGADRARIVRQLLAENLLLALLGAALGFVLAHWGFTGLAALTQGQSDGLGQLALNWRVLGFATALAVLTTAGFGLAPALRATRLDLTAEFQGGTRMLGGGRRSRFVRGLMILQVAVSLILLIGAGLFLRTVANLRTVDPGFDPRRLLLFSVDLGTVGSKPANTADLLDRMAARLGSLPGIRSVTYSTLPMLGNSGNRIGFKLPGYVSPSGEKPYAMLNIVAPDFFTTYALPIVLGRGFTAHDDAAAPRVAVVNQAFALKYFGRTYPLGQHIRDWEIVGVMRDAKQVSLREAASPVIMVPFAQNAVVKASFAVRTAGDPAAVAAAVRKAVGEIEPNLALNAVRTQEEQIERSLTLERMLASSAGALGLLALLLASVGLYGMVAYAVVRRTSEIGLRMALGAEAPQVLRMVLHESLWLVAAGCAAGVAVALGLTRLIANLLYGLSPADPLTYGLATLGLLAIALLAALRPALRATRIDPMVALRAE